MEVCYEYIISQMPLIVETSSLTFCKINKYMLINLDK